MALPPSQPPANTALYMDTECKVSVRHSQPVPTPADDEALIQVAYSGINPADIKHGTFLGIKPAVLGYDFSGHIISAPAGSGLSKGDVVAGHTPTGVGRPERYGAHQTQLACPVDWLYRVPSDGSLPLDHAACLSVVVCTAADVLFNVFKLDLPSSSSTSPPEISDSTLLIWGGSTAVGSSAIQYARACGIKSIFVTASPSRHEILKGLGATQCFDYNDPEFASKIRAAAAASSSPIRYGLDAVGGFASSDGSKKSTFEEMLLCCSDYTDDKGVSISSTGGEGKAILASVTAIDPRCTMPLATYARDTVIAPIFLPHTIKIPADRPRQDRIDLGLKWAIDNYGKGFTLPAVKVWKGTAEDALAELQRSADLGGFGKVAFKHPFE